MRTRIPAGALTTPWSVQEGDKGAHRALEDEPLLAARMVIEDCLCLLLDVDDIDRLWAAQGACDEADGPALPLFLAVCVEAEPLLAAHTVKEDCLCLLPEVDDIELLWAAHGGLSLFDGI